MIFDVQVKDARGLRDDDFNAMHRAEIVRVLDEDLPTVRRVVGRNLCNDNLPAWCFRWIMGGGSISVPYNRGSLGANGLASINLQTDEGDPGYTEGYETYTTHHLIGNDIGTGDSGKRFIEDTVDTRRIDVDPGGKEELRFRSRFLYLPSQAVSGSIKSIAYHFASNSDYELNTERGPLGRFRLKDAGGSPITISKNSSQVLQVQVLLKFASI